MSDFVVMLLCVFCLQMPMLDGVKPNPSSIYDFSVDPLGLYYLRQHLMLAALWMGALMWLVIAARQWDRLRGKMPGAGRGHDSRDSTESVGRSGPEGPRRLPQRTPSSPAS